MGNPRIPVIVMATLLFILGIGGAFLDASSYTHGLQLSFYATWLVVNIVTLSVSYWWLSKALRIKGWESWANDHNGTYERPNDMYITGYGTVMDKLSGINPANNQPFYLFRVLKVPMFAKGVRGSPSSAVLLSNTDEIVFPQEFQAVKIYLIKVPSVEEMLTLQGQIN